MLCEYVLRDGGPGCKIKSEISKYKFLDRGMLLITFGDDTSYIFVPYESLVCVKFLIKKEDNNGGKSEAILSGTEESGD